MTKDLGDWALANGMDDPGVRREADRFRDYWLSVPGTKGVKLDWPAVWRNWVRKAVDGSGKAARVGEQGRPEIGSTRVTAAGVTQRYVNHFDGWMREYS